MSYIIKFLRIPFHPILFGLYPIVQFLAFNIREVEITSSIRILIIVMTSILFLYLLLRILVRDWHRSALMVSIAALLFFSYGQVYSELRKVDVFGVNLGRHRYLLVVFLALLIVGWTWVLKKMKNVEITIGVNAIAFILLFVPLFQITSYELRFRKSHPSTTNIEISQPAVSSTEYPDIYYIITDAYTRDDTLLEYYGYDNTPFLKALEERGFYVAYCSHSNYTYTRLSLGSSLNMAYLQEFYQYDDLSGFEQVIKENLIIRLLNRIGYRIVAFATAFPPTNWTHADVYYSYRDQDQEDRLFKAGIREPEAVFIRTTAGLVILDVDTLLQERMKELIDDSASYDRYMRIKYNLDKLSTVPSIPGPKFVFAHITIPHEPYIFDENGDFVPNQTDNIVGYRGQVEYVNSRIIDSVDDILNHSDIPPIIVIQGDHGSVETVNDYRRTNILNAYYLPGGGTDALYPTITPVNTFRLILGLYFNSNTGLLPDVSYYSHWKDIFKFEVVPITRQGCIP